MATVIICLVVLVCAFLIDSKHIEHRFRIEHEHVTPAYTSTDGVDFVPIARWQTILIQFMNIEMAGKNIGFGISNFYITLLPTMFKIKSNKL